MNYKSNYLSRRFRGLMPVVVDVETSGLNPLTDALLEVAIVILDENEHHHLVPKETHAYHVEPFVGARLEKESLEINRIKPFHPLRFAIPEDQALYRIFETITAQLKKTDCYRAVLVGHNAWFDLSFMLSAIARSNIHYQPFHTFTTFDTATLAAVTLGETVLARAARRARIQFNLEQAHSAIYDVEKTAALFCHMVNGIKR